MRDTTGLSKANLHKGQGVNRDYEHRQHKVKAVLTITGMAIDTYQWYHIADRNKMQQKISRPGDLDIAKWMLEISSLPYADS